MVSCSKPALFHYSFRIEWTAEADAERLTECALSEASGGRIRPVIGQTFPAMHVASSENTAVDLTPLAVERLVVRIYDDSLRTTSLRAEATFTIARTTSRLGNQHPDKED